MATAESMPPADDMDSYTSSTLINPDLLLPHPARPPPSPPTSPCRRVHRAWNGGEKRMGTSVQNGTGWGIESDSTHTVHRAISPLILRPGLPGAWQTEEDFHTVPSALHKTRLPIQSSPTRANDPYDLRQPSPTLSGDDEDPWAGFDSEIANGGGIMSPGGSAVPPMASHLAAPSPAASQFKFPSFSTERSQFHDDEEDLTSHAAMSMRAETILANAKKRLLEMEDNLTRAHRSLSPNATKSRTMRLKLKKADSGGISENPDSWSLTPTKRQEDNNTHSRILSTSLLVGGTGLKSRRGKRAVSAMGYLSPRGTDWEPEDDEDPWTPLSRSTSNAGRQHDALDAVNEVEPKRASGVLDSARHRFRQSQSPRDQDGHASPRSSYLDPQAPHEVKRARSSTQLRDLREQMQDLRGRISSLRQRTREDSLQRQSMQKLKSPSPFTVAPGWEDDDAEDARASPRPASNPPANEVVEMEQELPVEVSAFEPDTPDESTDDPFDDVSPIPASPILEPESDPYTLDHGVVSPATPPRSSLPPSPSPRTPAHEDRPDAFNYEQYFLTSALPKYNKPIDPDLFPPDNTPFKASDPPPINVRRNTQSSSSSASTTKALSPSAVHESSTSSPGTEAMFSPKTLGGSQPSSPVQSVNALQESSSNVSWPSQKLTRTPITPIISAPPPVPTSTKASHLRQNSGDSISTVNTFSTATENAHSPSPDDDDDDADEDEGGAMSDLGVGFSHPGWQAAQNTRTRSGTVTPRTPTWTTNGHGPTANTTANGSALWSVDTHAREKRLSSGAQTPTAINGVSSPSPTVQRLSTRFPETSHLGEVDQQLVRDLLAALSRMCLDAQDLGDENVYERKVLRRKLDGARRVLEGEKEGVLRG